MFGFKKSVEAVLMKRLRIYFGLGFVTLLSVSIFFAGCTSTRIPVAERPPLYSQEKIQAVDHWDNIAIYVAERVQKTYEDRKDLVGRPIYIQPPNDRPFTKAFSSLLHTQLVSRGMQVSKEMEPDSVRLSYNLQLVNFDPSRTGWLPSLADVGLGVVNMVTGLYTTHSDQELIVNSSMVEGNRYAMHISKIYYINDDDWALYFNPVLGDEASESSRTVHLKNR